MKSPCRIYAYIHTLFKRNLLFQMIVGLLFALFFSSIIILIAFRDLTGHIIIFAFASTILLFIPVSAAILLIHRWLIPKPSPPGTCQTCGYDLRATPNRCPECGTETSSPHLRGP